MNKLNHKEKGISLFQATIFIICITSLVVLLLKGETEGIFGKSNKGGVAVDIYEEPSTEIISGSEMIDITKPVTSISVPVFDTVTMPMIREEVFETDLDGILGWRVSINGDKSIVYTTSDGKYAFLGMIVGPEGFNLTEQHVAEKIGEAKVGQGANPASPVQKPGIDGANAYTAVTMVPFVYQEGDGPVDIYITFDPRCPYCHQYSENLKSLHSQVTIHWIPIAVLGPQSDTQAQYLVDADDPLSLHHKLMAGMAPTEMPKPSSKAIETILGNTRIAMSAGLTMTPLTVAMTKQGPVALPGSLEPAKLMAIIQGQ